MNSIIDDLEELIKPFYKDNNATDRLPRVRDVCKRTIEICNHRNDPFVVRRLSVISVYLHEIFDNKEEDHPHRSAAWILDHTLFLQKLFKIRDIDVKVISDACREHRTSYKGEYSSIVSEIVSAAYRDSPRDLRDMLLISKDFGEIQLKLLGKEAKERALKDIYEKYGRNGSVKYNDVYKDFYNDKLESLWNMIDEIDLSLHDQVGIFNRLIN